MAVGVGVSVGPVWVGKRLGGRGGRGRGSGSGGGGGEGAAVLLLLCGLLVFAGVWVCAVLVWAVVWLVLAAWGALGVVGRWLWMLVSRSRWEAAGGFWGVFQDWLAGGGERRGVSFAAARWLWRTEFSQWLLLQRWGEARGSGWLRWLSAGAWVCVVCLMVGGAWWAAVAMEAGAEERRSAPGGTGDPLSAVNCGWRAAEQAACARAAGLEYPSAALAENYRVVGLCWSEPKLDWVAC